MHAGKCLAEGHSAQCGERSAEETLALIADRVANDFAFVARATLPADARVVVFGDLHGQLDAFVFELAHLREAALLEDSMRLAANTYAVIMGDLVDRGPMGAAVYALAMAFAVNNPGRVFILRGYVRLRRPCATPRRLGS